jgi:uncharacterized protein YbjT (DUF2867 family)
VTDVLLTGASGHVGGALLRACEADGLAVRCLARSPEKLTGLAETTEVVEGDVLDPDSTAAALAGVRTAYFLVHSLAAGGGFAAEEGEGAETFARAAREAGVGRIVYLGGLAHGDDLSDHMRSRHEVGRILRESGVPTLELRASIVIGDGSLSFELIRQLVDGSSALALPSWADAPCQPIALADVVAYLRAAHDVELADSRIVEIGGAEATTYRALIEAYAEARSLPTAVVSVPVPSLPFSSGDVPGLDRLLPERLRAPVKLLESLRHDSSVRSDEARRLFPGLEPRGVREALAAAGV